MIKESDGIIPIFGRLSLQTICRGSDPVGLGFERMSGKDDLYAFIDKALEPNDPSWIGEHNNDGAAICNHTTNQ